MKSVTYRIAILLAGEESTVGLWKNILSFINAFGIITCVIFLFF